METSVQHSRPAVTPTERRMPLGRANILYYPMHCKRATRSALTCRAAMDRKQAQNAMVAGLIATCLVRACVWQTIFASNVQGRSIRSLYSSIVLYSIMEAMMI